MTGGKTFYEAINFEAISFDGTLLRIVQILLISIPADRRSLVDQLCLAGEKPCQKNLDLEKGLIG